MLLKFSMKSMDMKPFSTLNKTTREALQKVCGMNCENTEILYANIVLYYVWCTKYISMGGGIFNETARPDEHRAVGSLFKQLEKLIFAYDQLTPIGREIAEIALQDPELDFKAKRDGNRPFGNHELRKTISALRRVHERFSTSQGPTRGRPKLRSLSEPAMHFCSEWEDTTGHAPSWNDKGTTGLFEFHRLASEQFDAVIAMQVSADDGSDLKVTETKFSHYRSAAGQALRDAVRERRKAK